MYFPVCKLDRKIVKHKTDTISMLIFQNLQRAQILEAASLISHPSSEEPNGAPAEDGNKKVIGL